MFQRFSRTGIALVSVCFVSLLQLPCLADSMAGSEGWTSSSWSSTTQSGGVSPLYNGPSPQGSTQQGNPALWNNDNQWTPNSYNGNAYNRTEGNKQLWNGMGTMNSSMRVQTYAPNGKGVQTYKTNGNSEFKPFSIDKNGVIHTSDGRLRDTAASVQKRQGN